MDFDIPEELQLLARTARDFVETRLQPIEREVEEERRANITLRRTIIEEVEIRPPEEDRPDPGPGAQERG